MSSTARESSSSFFPAPLPKQPSFLMIARLLKDNLPISP